MWYSYDIIYKKTQDILTVMVDKYFKISGYSVLWGQIYRK
jgi:hypothetical protein